MRPWIALWALGFSGCALQGGAHAGYASNPKRGMPDQATWGGHAQGQVGLPLGGPWALHVGVEAEGRGEEHQGSLFTWGPQLGVEARLGARVRLLGHADAGWPVGWSNPVSGHYLGFTAELPIWTRNPKRPSRINRDLRFIDQEGAIVPYLRLRTLALEVRGADQGTAYELVAGFAFRTTLVTDLL